MNKKSIEILDCTIRDGGYLNNWKFEKPLVREIYRALSKSGVDYVEIGFRGTTKYFNKEEFGLWRFTTEKEVEDISVNIQGAKLGLMADYGKFDIDDFIQADESLIELVRVACNKNDLKDAIIKLEKIKEKGYKVALNAMGYTNFSEDERKNLIQIVQSANIDYIYIADSYGSLFPDQIEALFSPLIEIKNIKVGFHPHNSLQMAFANTIEALKAGVHIVDSTIYGMGRAAGNLQTEIIIAYLEREGGNRFNSIPILNIIDKYFGVMLKQHPWGYQLPYMLSGMFQCHPSYAKALTDLKEYTIEDVWKTLEYIKKKKPVGYSKKLLNSVITEGIIGGFENTHKKETTDKNNSGVREEIPYKDRHKGRDFLILANGPSLIEYKDKIEHFIKKYDPIVLGGNYLGQLITPHYHAFNNKRRFTTYVATVSADSTLLIGENMRQDFIEEYVQREYETLYFKDILNSDFNIIDGVIQTNCRTISVLLLGVAIVMGGSRVFAVGMDGYMGSDNESEKPLHFYKEEDEKDDIDMIVERHRWCQKIIEQIDSYLFEKGHEGIHILTPTSYKTFYKSIENYI